MKILIIIIITSLFCFSCKPQNNTKKTKDRPQEITPGPDPLVKYQWHLKNTGSHYLIGTSGLAGADINLDTLHEEDITGRGVVIAISDTDLQYNHADLIENFSILLSRNYEFNPPYAKAPLSDLSNADHATAVAGLAAAVKNNSLGGKGVAPSATLAGFNYLSVDQTSSTTTDQASGTNIDIFNFSYGNNTCAIINKDIAFNSALKNGVESQRQAKGSIYIKAAGNEYVGYQKDCTGQSDNTFYFGNANYDPDNTTPYTILVGALNSSGVSSNFSTPGANLWVSAPGGDTELNHSPLVTTDVMGCNLGYSNNKDFDILNSFERGKNILNPLCDFTADVSGTSFAAPLVSGVVALMLQVNPTLKWRDVKHILAFTAVQIGSEGHIMNHPIPNQNLTGHIYDLGMVQNEKNYMYNNYYGFGRIDARAAVEMAKTYQVNLGEFIERTVNSGSMNLIIPDNNPTGISYSLYSSERLFVESVELKITTTGANVSDLGIELTSPGNTTVTVTNINSNNISANFNNTSLIVNAFYRESAHGNWKIRVIDGKETIGAESKLVNFTLTFYGTINEI